VPYSISSPGGPEANQSLLNAFVRNLPAAVAMLDRNMRYLQASDRWCLVYGLNFKQVLGRSHYEIFPNIPERWNELYRRGLAGETLRSAEDLFERPGGRRIWLRWEIRPWGNPGAPPEGILIFSEDITKAKEAEEALARQLDRLEKIVATIPGAICAFRLNPDGSASLPYASPGFRKMLPELPDLREDAAPFFAMIHPEDVGRVRASIEESARTMTHWRDSYRVPTPERGEIWIEGHSIPTRQPDGSIVWYGYLSDITERKRMEQALVSAKREYRDLIDNSPDSISRLDPEGRYLFVNAYRLKFTGLREEDFVGRRVDEVGFPDAVTKRAMQSIRRVAATGQGEEAEFSLPVAGVETFWRSRFIPEFDTDRSVRSVLLISTDITVRKQTEIALRESAAELEKVSLALIAAEEDAARQVARELHDDITHKLAFLSMEIGKTAASPLPAAALVTELRAFQARILDISENIRRISHQMHPSILDDLGLDAALESMCEDLQRIEGMPVRFAVRDFPETIDRRVASCLYRVAQESLRNVSKHAKADEVTVVLSSEDGVLQLSIADSGIGFDAAARKGLGTHSMRERVRLVNGNLSVTSAPGQGTRVVVRVPLDRREDRNAHSAGK
jgi:PAS domain S-box-containing protein